MTLSDPNPGFKVSVYLQVEYLKKRCVLGSNLLKNTNRIVNPEFRNEGHDLPNGATFDDLQ